MHPDDVTRLITVHPDVTVLVAGPENGAPEVAWGDSFFYRGAGRTMPFATIVVSDYPGFDTDSRLDRDGVYRVNLAVGRRVFAEVFGFGPEAFPQHRDSFDFTELDRLLPHPQYATQSWLSIVVPDSRTADRLPELIEVAYTRART